MYKVCLTLFLLLSFPLCGGVPLEILQKFVEQGITIDLKNVKYENRVIFTEEGGVITGPGLKVQGRCIYLSFEEEDEGPILLAQGDLFVEYGAYVLVGDEFIFDFKKEWGLLNNGCLGYEPWFFKACSIELLPCGEIRLNRPQITTTEEQNPAWSLVADEAILERGRYLRAFNLRFQVGKVPLFWLPWLKGDLEALLDHPIKYRIRWGGEQGLRIGMIANIFSWNGFELFFRFDYRFNRGPGAALESEYLGNEGRTFAKTINYIAHDNSIEIPHQRMRFRFQGIFDHTSWDDRTEFHFSYDKLSDNEMATDYFERGLELKTGRKTEASLIHRAPRLITSLYTRVKINNFETVKQELPTLTLTPYPTFFERFGWIFEGEAKVGFLDFSYPSETPPMRGYQAGRIFFDPKIYKTSNYGPLQVTTTLGGVGIAYSNRANNDFGWLALGFGEMEGKLRFQAYKHCFSHTIEPYVALIGYTPPSLSPNNHFIFDIQDGWSSLQYTRFGVRNLFYLFGGTDQPVRSLTSDLYANLFLGKVAGSDPIPKVHLDFLFDASASVRHVVESAWDLNHQELDHFNYRVDWTLNEDVAFAAEYRTRSRYSWRKLDPDNYFLDAERPVRALLHSPLSDRRETFLLKSFFRFLPNMALVCQVRHGWHRRREPNYIEYEIDLLTTIGSIWELKISYQKKEDDHDIALYFNINQDRPCLDNFCY